ncbi:DUF1667 domain-containing protein [Alloiococcus sp. CFN-8]|uniref:DUF1667 domain-containing protein n=1 Tax=Alloiococcus sp. CFN-8 TaxID=3416081 RepID=UPI003CF71060
MEVRQLVCIRCPIGCNLEVTLDKGKDPIVTGYGCKRGIEYGSKECTNPTRIVTSIIPVLNGEISMVPVKTNGDIPKGLIKDCIKALKGIELTAPVKIGDVVIKNFAGTGVDIVATRDINIQ